MASNLKSCKKDLIWGFLLFEAEFNIKKTTTDKIYSQSAHRREAWLTCNEKQKGFRHVLSFILFTFDWLVQSQNFSINQ